MERSRKRRIMTARFMPRCPAWYNWVYAAAVGTGLLGGIALLSRSSVARTLFIVSLVAVVIQFGYSFAATDLIAHKGAAATVPFPAVHRRDRGVGVWFAGYATRRGWIS